MQKKMTLKDLQDLYQTENIAKTERGFEIPHTQTGMMMVVPEKMYLSANGSPMVPTRMLIIPRTCLLDKMLGFEFDVAPLELWYLCGKGENCNDCWYFWPADLKSVSTSPDMQAVLLRAHWDRNQNVDGRKWDEEMRRKFAGHVYYSHCDCDDYGESGDWYWLVSVGWPPVQPFSGTGLFGALFSWTMRPVLQRAGKAMSEFRKHKREYGEKIKEILDPALEQMRADKRDLTVLYGDDKTLLSDFGYGPRDKVKPKNRLYRHDSVGLKHCKDDFAWASQEKN